MYSYSRQYGTTVVPVQHSPRLRESCVQLYLRRRSPIHVQSYPPRHPVSIRYRVTALNFGPSCVRAVDWVGDAPRWRGLLVVAAA